MECLNAPFSDRSTLVFDFIEEFRAPVVDRAVVSLIRRRKNQDVDSEQITPAAPQEIVKAVMARLYAPVQFRGRRIDADGIIVHQARESGRFLRGENKAYLL